MKSPFKVKTPAVRESFTGYEMDLLALWLRGSISSSDPDLLKMLASLDADRHLLYREMHAELHPRVSTLLEPRATQTGPTTGDCGTTSGRQRCERPKGHEGYHESYGWHGRSEERW